VRIVFGSILGYDLSERTRRDSLAFPVNIVRKPDTVAVSDVELCSNISESSDKTDPFYKNTYRVIPNPSCMFGTTTQPVVFTYAEFYNLSPGFPYDVKAQITDSRGDVKKQRVFRRQFSKSNIVDVGTLNVASIASGKYTYAIILADTLGHEITRTERPIFLYNPNVQQSRGAGFSARTSEFAGMTSEELEKEFQTAQYIASPEDVDAFAKLTTADARREFLAKFWTRIENSETVRTGMTRMIYLQRVQTANQRYRAFGREGWRTDRGRVYIMYGEPDEVQRFPNSQDSKPYEIWNYHQIEGGVEFVFIDRTGFNEYTLVHSTKRGEVQDDSWEQLLH
jgi:GWxTD domain-containing protein